MSCFCKLPQLHAQMYNLINVSGMILDCYKQMRWIRLQFFLKRNVLYNTI